MRAVVGKCKKCQSTDLPPTLCLKGKLDVSDTWYQVEMDITYYQDRHCHSLIADLHVFLSGITWDGKMRQISLTTWKPYSMNMVHQMKCLQTMTQHFAASPSGTSWMNGEWVCGSTVCMSLPVMASWNKKAVYWYNITLKDDVLLLTAPANMIHQSYYHEGTQGTRDRPWVATYVIMRSDGQPFWFGLGFLSYKIFIEISVNLWMSY